MNSVATPLFWHPYLAGFGLTVLALLAGFLLHSKFMALGGPNHSVARE
jgi:hypothetical protein